MLKAAGKGIKFIKKRYTKKGAPLGINMGNIAKDVARLKALVNAELKRTQDVRYIHSNVAQMVGNASGHSISDISPSFIAQGSDYYQRTGNSIKLKSLMINAQFIQQANTNQQINGSIELWMRKQDIVTTLTATQELYNSNIFVTGGNPIYDLNSTRNPDFYQDYVLIRAKRFTVKSDTLSPQINSITNVSMPIKLGKDGIHARWDKGGVYTDKQFLLMIRADCGNHSAATAGVFGRVATNAVNTGLDTAVRYQYFFYDN